MLLCASRRQEEKLRYDTSQIACGLVAGSVGDGHDMLHRHSPRLELMDDDIQ